MTLKIAKVGTVAERSACKVFAVIGEHELCHKASRLINNGLSTPEITSNTDAQCIPHLDIEF